MSLGDSQWALTISLLTGAVAIDTWLPHIDTVPPDMLLDVIIGSLPAG